MKAIPRPILKESMRIAENASKTSDADLMLRLSQGDLASLGILYDRHHKEIAQFVMRCVGSNDCADIVHDVFLTLVRVANAYDGRQNARPFLIGIAAQLVKQKRQRFARVTRALEGFAATLVGVVRRTPEDAAGNTQAMTAFQTALSTLSEEKRLVFVMIEAEGLSGNEVAEALSIPVATVWTRLHYARRVLREAIVQGRRQ